MSSAQSANDPTFGAIKLNKVLYYSDFAAYRQLGQPITGATYRKFFEGPAPIELPDVRRELIDSGDATSEERPYFAGSVVRLVIRTGREPNRELFRPGELEIVDQVVDFLKARRSGRLRTSPTRSLDGQSPAIGRISPTKRRG